MIMLMILRWRDYFGLFGWWVLSIITRVLIRGRGRLGYKREDDAMMEEEIGGTHSKDEGRGHEPRYMDGLLQAEKTRKRDSLRRASRRNQPCQLFDFSPVKPTSSFRAPPL